MTSGLATKSLKVAWRRCWKDTFFCHRSWRIVPLSQDEIVKALKWVTQRAKRLSVHVCTVFHGKRLRGFASAHRYTYARTVDQRPFELALLLALSQSSFSVSSETWRQRRGVPIRGLVSKIFCQAVMGASETQWSKTGNAGSPLILLEKTTSLTFDTWTTLSRQPACTAVIVSWPVRP